MERWTDGRQTRLVDTDDFLKIAEEESKMDLDWFFEMYLRQPKLPRLVGDISGGVMREVVSLNWETPNNMPFPMPVDVEINGKIQRVEMKDGRGSVRAGNAKYEIDPKGWILKAQ
jgi:aminopeptidase N